MPKKTKNINVDVLDEKNEVILKKDTTDIDMNVSRKRKAVKEAKLPDKGKKKLPVKSTGNKSFTISAMFDDCSMLESKNQNITTSNSSDESNTCSESDELKGLHDEVPLESSNEINTKTCKSRKTQKKNSLSPGNIAKPHTNFESDEEQETKKFKEIKEDRKKKKRKISSEKENEDSASDKRQKKNLKQKSHLINDDQNYDSDEFMSDEFLDGSLTYGESSDEDVNNIDNILNSSFESGESGDEYTVKKKKMILDCRVCPNSENQNVSKDRNLRIIATQGIVQLFSTINSYQVETERKLTESKTETEREKVLGSGRDVFLGLFEQKKSSNKRVKKSEMPSLKSEEVKEEEGQKSTWNVFADNFYKDSVTAGWDKDNSDG